MLLRLLYTIRLGIQTVRLHRLRSLLTVLGVVFGVASVIIMLAVGEGAREKAIAAINELGAHNSIISSVEPSARSLDGAGTGAIRYGLTDRDVRSIKAMLPSGAKLTKSRQQQQPVRRLGQRVEARLTGVTPSFSDLHDLQVSEGRFISDLDNDRGLAVAVLSSGVAETLFPLSEPVGRTIRVGNDRYFRVIGVLNSPAPTQGKQNQGRPARFEQDVFIPFQSDRARFGENITFDPSGMMPPEKVEILAKSADAR